MLVNKGFINSTAISDDNVFATSKNGKFCGCPKEIWARSIMEDPTDYSLEDSAWWTNHRFNAKSFPEFVRKVLDSLEHAHWALTAYDPIGKEIHTKKCGFQPSKREIKKRLLELADQYNNWLQS